MQDKIFRTPKNPKQNVSEISTKFIKQIKELLIHKTNSVKQNTIEHSPHNEEKKHSS